VACARHLLRWGGGLTTFLPWLASNCDPFKLCLLSSRDYRHTQPHSGLISEIGLHLYIVDIVAWPFKYIIQIIEFGRDFLLKRCYMLPDIFHLSIVEK
jgi:hypothetical protein